MGEVEWIKLYLKTFRESRKIGAIEQMKNGDTLVLIWIKLLCLAGEVNDGGAIYITADKPYSPDMLAVELRKPRAIVETALRVFAEYGMILQDDAGFIQVLNWEKYQSADRLDEIRKQATERKRRERARKKQDSVRDMSRDCHATHSATVTPCHGIEEEKEGEGDQENHSILLSRACGQEQAVTAGDGAKREILAGALGGGVVMLSADENAILLRELSPDEYKYYVGVVRDCELKGQKFRKKTHFQAIMDMATADRAKASKPRMERPPRLPKNQPTESGPFDTDEFFMANVQQTFGEDFDLDLLKNNKHKTNRTGGILS